MGGTRADLRALDDRMTRVHRDRGWAMVALVLTYIALVLFTRTAAVTASAAAITASLVLSALGATRFWLVLAAIVALTAALAVAGATLTVEQAWSAAHVDEDWNMDFWGRDELAMQRRAARFADMAAAGTVLALTR